IRPPPHLHASTLSLPIHTLVSKHSPRSKCSTAATTMQGSLAFAARQLKGACVSPDNAKRGLLPKPLSPPRRHLSSQQPMETSAPLKQTSVNLQVIMRERDDGGCAVVVRSAGA